MCHKFIPDGLKRFTAHLRHSHSLSVSAPYSFGYQCGQDECQCVFRNFTSLIRHLRVKHPILRNRNNESSLFQNYMEVGSNMEVETEDPEQDSYRSVPEGNSSKDSVLEGNNSQKVFSISGEAAKMVAHLRSKAFVTGATLTQVFMAAEVFICNVANIFEQEVMNYFSRKDISLNQADIHSLLSKFEISAPFDKFLSIEEQVKALKMYYKFVDSVEIPLGDRCESMLNRQSGEYEPKLVIESFQYVPIIESLKLILSHSSVRKYIEEESSSSDGFLRGFRDGESFKKSPFFQKYPQALRIQLYYDDILVNNPLGSKTSAHKLGAFYFTIQNLPPHLQSFMGGVQVLGLCYTADVTKYGFKEILSPFLDDLNKLESEEGVMVCFDGEPFVLRATIACVVADGLAAHQMFGFLGPSANHFCRSCMIHRSDLLKGRVAIKTSRTREMYDEQVRKVKSKLLTDTETGLRENSALHRSRFWHCADNFVFDPMHDIWQGIAPVILEHVIKHFIKRENEYNLTLTELNNRIQMFQYGMPEKKNKPSPNFTLSNFYSGNPIQQKAVQTWCLLRIFPFLVSDKVPKGDEYLHLVLLLNRISEIVFSPIASPSQAPYLQDLVLEFVSSFKELFPNITLINKFHHLMHYWECLIKSGPLRSIVCLRYEAKHSIFKKYGSQCCNFKNLPFSMIRLSQISQCVTWGSNDAPRKKIICSKGQTVLVKNCQGCKYLKVVGIADNANIFETSKVEIYGVQYRSGWHVAVKSGRETESGNPVFATIMKIYICESDRVYFLCREWETLGYECSLNSFSVASGLNIILISADDLKDVKPFALWRDYCSTGNFITLRHILI